MPFCSTFFNAWVLISSSLMQARRLFVRRYLERLLDRQFAVLRLPPPMFWNMPWICLVIPPCRAARRFPFAPTPPPLRSHFLVVEFALAQPSCEFLARAGALVGDRRFVMETPGAGPQLTVPRAGAATDVEHAVLGSVCPPAARAPRASLLAAVFDGGLGQSRMMVSTSRPT